MRHQKRNRNSDSPFQHLYSGHRFCYVSKIRESFPRYTTYSIPDPIDATSLMDVEVTIFHDGQRVNCKSCKADDHAFPDCPHRVTCHNCGKKGHIRKWCRAEKSDAPTETTRNIEQEVEVQLKAARRKATICPTNIETTHADDNQSEKEVDPSSDLVSETVESMSEVESECTDDQGREHVSREDVTSGASSTPGTQREEHSGGTQQNRPRLRSSRRTTSTAKRKDVLTPPEANKPGKLRHKDEQKRQKDIG
ncbi:Hypp5748 [Branchiostoma lanceolatum]|uniref:Hypp5748 protein n=1 Tax=Branchiostoma lanceolatum TaxID=7740 RepID=A0A8J9YNU1_BRALA|nr:Hypp5748 [Branchiostoma lanceolatum]